MTTEKRFAFGQNWKNFLETLSEERIQEAEKSLKKSLNKTDLKGLSFLDVGCGSGLFSLAAHRLGAKVISFDYDQKSVDCAEFLKDKFKITKDWEIFQGSVLDDKLIKSLGTHDIVYSWGVLHHTGHMYKAFENVVGFVKKEGTLFISIYNDQGLESKIWTKLKKTYAHSGKIIKGIIIGYTAVRCWTLSLILDFIRHGNPFRSFQNYKKSRGMSAYYDIIDWAGGYPFEVAKPEEVFDFFHERKFNLTFLKTCQGGLGCNEFVFIKNS
ncbi:MAG: class I SAM-dependent methyltransferase [Alphaproteobacteria bacterium]